MTPRPIDVSIRGKNDTSKAFAQAEKSAQSFGKKIGEQLNPLNAVKAALAGLTIGALGAFAKKSVESAAEADAAWSRVESAVTNAGIGFNLVRADLDKLFASIQATTRYSDDQAADAFTTLLNITRDYSGSVKNLTLATDIAAAKKIDLSTAAELVAKAAIGETGALKKQGIVIREGVDAIDALHQRFDGFANRDATSMQGQLHQVANAWDNVLEAMGRALLGMGDQGATGIAAKLTSTLGDFSRWIDDNSGKLRSMGDGLLRIVTLLGKLADWTIGGPLRGVADIASGEFFADDTPAGFVLGKIARGMYGDQEDAGSGQYYKDLGRIRARSRQRAQQQAAAAKAAADAANYKAKYDQGDFDANGRRLAGVLDAGAGLPRVGLTGGAPGTTPALQYATEKDAQASQVLVQSAVAAQQELQKATDSVFSLGDAFDNIKVNAIGGFADAWSGAVVAIVTGSDKAGRAILKAFRSAIGGAMMAEGQQNILSAAAIAVKGVFNPVDWARAAKLFAIGTAQLSAGALFAGGGGGGGGGSAGLSSSSFASQQNDVGDRGSMTFVFEGGLLDMTDPRQEQAFVSALQSVSGRRVITIKNA